MAGTGIVGLPWRPQACGGGPSRDRLLISSRAGYCLVPCSCFSQSVNHHCDSDHGSQKKPCPVDIKGTPPFAPVTDRVAAPNCPSTTMIALIVKVPLMFDAWDFRDQKTRSQSHRNKRGNTQHAFDKVQREPKGKESESKSPTHTCTHESKCAAPGARKPGSFQEQPLLHSSHPLNLSTQLPATRGFCLLLSSRCY